MFFPKTNVKDDPMRRWQRPDWLREPNQLLHDAMPHARAFVQRFGDLRSDIMDLRDRLNTKQAQDELNEVKPIIDIRVDGTMMGFAGAQPILGTGSR